MRNKTEKVVLLLGVWSEWDILYVKLFPSCVWGGAISISQASRNDIFGIPEYPIRGGRDSVPNVGIRYVYYNFRFATSICVAHGHSYIIFFGLI